VVLADGSFLMFYDVPGEGGAVAIGEARSADGIVWERAGSGPALAPSPAPESGAGEEPYDGAAVSDAAPALATSATGRAMLRVYYSARDRTGRSAIGMAARFGDGALERAVGPVFGASSSLGPRAPWVVIYPELSLLFVTQRAGSSDALAYPAVAAGVAPADARLGAPDPL
jgi:hypothetical protein